jgi:WD40 repeat protein
MILELVQDFSAALAAMPAEHPRRRILSLFELALRQESTDLRRFMGQTGAMPFSDFLFQQLRNRVYCDSDGQYDPATQWSDAHHPEIMLNHEAPQDQSRFVTTFEADPGTGILRFHGKVRFTPDGKRLVVAAVRSRVPVFNVAEGRKIVTLDCIGRAIAIDFSVDGNLLVATGDIGAKSETGFLEVFDLETGQSLARRRTEILIHNLVTTSTGQIVACCGNSLKVYSIMDLETQKEWQPYGQSVVLAIARNRQHTIFATGEYHDEKRSALISVWNAATCKRITEFDGSKYGITALAFSDDDRLLASGSSHLVNDLVKT